MSVRTVSLNEVSLSDKPTHIVIYQESPIQDTSELKKQFHDLSIEFDKLSKRVLQMELASEEKTKLYFSSHISPEPEGITVNRVGAEQVEVEEAEVEEAEVEEETLQHEEFEYKGVTYYRDSENLVYQQDDDGDLDDTPIGVWSPEKEKVVKYKA